MSKDAPIGVYSLEPETDKIVQKLPFKTHGYIFKEVIGHGSYSVVFRVYHAKSRHEFAAKAIHIKYEDERSSVNICDSEIMSLKSLCHPNIIKFYDFFHKYKHLFLILQLCECGTVKQLIVPYSGLPLKLLLNLMRQILEGISFCHFKGITHRDLKPENIFIDHYGRPLLADFGFSAQTKPEANYDDVKVDSFCGSFIYKAPELIEKRLHNPFKADIWALGVTFYVMAFGVAPWPRTSQEVTHDCIVNCRYTFPPKTNENLAAVIQSMLVFAPEQRLTAAQILELPFFTDGSPETSLGLLFEKVNFTSSTEKPFLKNKIGLSGSMPPLCLRIQSRLGASFGGMPPNVELPANFVTANNPGSRHTSLVPLSLPTKKQKMPNSKQQNATDPIKIAHSRNPVKSQKFYPLFSALSIL